MRALIGLHHQADADPYGSRWGHEAISDFLACAVYDPNGIATKCLGIAEARPQLFEEPSLMSDISKKCNTETLVFAAIMVSRLCYPRLVARNFRLAPHRRKRRSFGRRCANYRVRRWTTTSLPGGGHPKQMGSTSFTRPPTRCAAMLCASSAEAMKMTRKISTEKSSTSSAPKCERCRWTTQYPSLRSQHPLYLFS